MAVKNTIAVAVEIEDTEGVYKAPTTPSSFVQTLSDGFELAPSKELLERNIFTGSIGKVAPRTGQFQVSGSIPTECRAHSLEGEAPEYDALMHSALGEKRQKASSTTTKSSGNTGSVLAIEDDDIADFAVGDIVLVKEAGAYHMSPVSAVNTTPGAATITLLVPKPSGSFSASVVIAPFTTYTVANDGHPSLSISKYIEGTLLEQAVGCRVNSVSLENFTTGQIPTWNFAFEGLNFDRSVTAQPHSPSYDSAQPPIILDAHVYMDGSSLEVNSVTVSIENTIGFKTATRAPNGRYSGRATERTISGSIDPFKDADNINNFLKYKNNQAFSLFAMAKIPTGVGTYNQCVAIYMPNCMITEMGEADQDGQLQETISFSANRGDGNTQEIYIAFI